MLKLNDLFLETAARLSASKCQRYPDGIIKITWLSASYLTRQPWYLADSCSTKGGKKKKKQKTKQQFATIVTDIKPAQQYSSKTNPKTRLFVKTEDEKKRLIV